MNYKRLLIIVIVLCGRAAESGHDVIGQGDGDSATY